jgi:hypothetical protein
MMDPIKGGGARKRRKSGAAPSKRIARRPSRQESTMTKIDSLIEVAKKLREARALGERCSDRALLYFIDMTIAHVCATLDARCDIKTAEVNHPSVTKAAA